MNIFDFNRLYRTRIKGTGITGSTVYLKLDPVEPGTIRVLTHVTVENKTSAYTLLRLSIYDGATDFVIDECQQPAADELAIHKQDILLGERDVLRATLTGTTTDDDLELLAIGWEMIRSR